VAHKEKTAAIRGQTAGKHRDISNDALSSDGLVELLRDAMGLAWTHAREGAGCYVFHSDARRVEFEGAMAACGWHVAQNLVWVKDAFVLGTMDYHSQHEPVFYGWKPGGRHAWYGGRKRSALVVDQEPDLDTLERDELVSLLRERYGSRTTSATTGRGVPTSIPHEAGRAPLAAHRERTKEGCARLRSFWVPGRRSSRGRQGRIFLLRRRLEPLRGRGGAACRPGRF
jgi:hypothetical protein